eukprot:gene1970-2333_t
MELCHTVNDHNSSNLPGILLWLDHYLTRLESGVCGVRPLRTLDPGPTRGWYISLFPNRGHSSHSGEITNTAPREYVCNVVNGVQVTASVVHVGTLESDRIWAYSLSLRLLYSHPTRPPHLTRCQLTTRHWRIRESHRPNVVFEVDGPGVIGLFPILTAEREGRAQPAMTWDSDVTWWVTDHDLDVSRPFEYQSCTNLCGDHTAVMSGWFDFVPGTIEAPMGPPFSVEVPEFDIV